MLIMKNCFHLLVDRKGFLPLVEVFGGYAPKGAERRANAFAAELLLPRSVAFHDVKQKQGEKIET